MVELAPFLEESDVADAEGLGSTFFFGDVSAEILARSHCEEEGADTELGNCDFLDGVSVFGKLAEDDERKRFLLFAVLVEVSVTAVLLGKKDR